MDLFTSHWRALTGTGAGIVLLYLLQRWNILGGVVNRLWNVPKAIHQTDAQLILGQTQLAALREVERNEARLRCDELEVECAQLAKDLKEETRKVLLREQINSEDTAFIRALKQRLREKGIDYSDLNTQFRRTE